MKRTVKVIVIMAIVAMIMGIVNISNAFSFNANLSSSDKLVAGQEVKVTLSLSGIDMDEGIRSIKVGKITIGEEFEPISLANFTSNTWMPTYSNGGLILMSGTPVKNEGLAVTLTLKVKAGVTAKSSTVKFENIVASSGSNTGDISAGTKTITIQANQATSEIGTGTETGTTNPSLTNPNNTQTGTNKPAEKNTSSTTKKETSYQTLPNKLPKAGNGEGIVIISLILIIIVVAIVSFVKYKKIR